MIYICVSILIMAIAVVAIVSIQDCNSKAMQIALARRHYCKNKSI